MDRCLNCGALLTTGGCPNQCAYRSGVIQYSNSHAKCECHQCTWLRASQFDRECFKQLPIVLSETGSQPAEKK